MHTIRRTYLPEEVQYNGKTYIRAIEESAKLSLGQPIDTTGCILVTVLSKNLRGKTDLHGKPYQPTQWLFKKAN